MKEKEEKKMEITIVREENQSYFEPLMPRELWEKSDLVLGAIEEGAACGYWRPPKSRNISWLLSTCLWQRTIGERG